MDFLDALGLDRSISGSEMEIRSDICASTAAVVACLVAVPKAGRIADKLMRLERYCAAPTRLALDARSDHALRFVAPASNDAGEMAQRLAILSGLLQRAGFDNVTRDRDGVSWTGAPDVPPLDTGGSARLTDHLHRLLASDPARAWRIENAAAHLGLSSRSLQRYLLAEGGTFSVALRRARTDVAMSLLRQSTLSLAEIGFCCGYADQAHFQREFRKVVGMTPRQFKTQGGKLQRLVKTAP